MQRTLNRSTMPSTKKMAVITSWMIEMTFKKGLLNAISRNISAEETEIKLSGSSKRIFNAGRTPLWRRLIVTAVTCTRGRGGEGLGETGSTRSNLSNVCSDQFWSKIGYRCRQFGLKLLGMLALWSRIWYRFYESVLKREQWQVTNASVYM